MAEGMEGAAAGSEPVREAGNIPDVGAFTALSPLGLRKRNTDPAVMPPKKSTVRTAAAAVFLSMPPDYDRVSKFRQDRTLDGKRAGAYTPGTMKKLVLPLFVLLFGGAVMTACDNGDKDKKDEAPAQMPTPQDYGGGS